MVHNIATFYVKMSQWNAHSALLLMQIPVHILRCGNPDLEVHNPTWFSDLSRSQPFHLPTCLGESCFFFFLPGRTDCWIAALEDGVSTQCWCVLHDEAQNDCEHTGHNSLSLNCHADLNFTCRTLEYWLPISCHSYCEKYYGTKYYQKYLDIVVNKNDITVLDSVGGIIRNLHLAGEGFFWVPFDGFPNHFIQAQVSDISRGMGAVHDFPL